MFSCCVRQGKYILGLGNFWNVFYMYLILLPPNSYHLMASLYKQSCTYYAFMCVLPLFLFLHPMMTSSNGNIFRVTGHLCGEFTGPGEFPAQRPVTRSFDVLFDLRLNKRLSKQSWGWWFDTLSRPLWRHCNAFICFLIIIDHIEAETKWPPFGSRHFKIHFLEWKCVNFDWDFTYVCS